MNVMSEIVEARASAISLRASARACGPEHGPLKCRLMRATCVLNSMVLLAIRGIRYIEVLEAALRECVAEMQAWDRMDDRTERTRAAIERALRALQGMQSGKDGAK